ncbi:MAG: hypothetical protein HQK54_08790 [Oligoflexales bacterium]|nr:hypothetical protein [Oligoflexales bacterium]
MQFEWIPEEDADGRLLVMPGDIRSDQDKLALSQLISMLIFCNGMSTEITPDIIDQLLEKIEDKTQKVEIIVEYDEDEVGLGFNYC